MSRTYRRTPTHMFRGVKTCSELKQIKVNRDYYSDEYPVRIRKRYIPTLWDDIHVSANKELDHGVSLPEE